MKSHRTIALLGALLWAGLAAGAAEAQASSQEAAVAAEVPPADTTDAETTDADTAKKKGGGMFGKVKGLAKNKIVRQVAKTAACTMVPGGQVIAGAIDAASSEGVAGAAQGAAGAATGSSCGLPGMGPANAAGAATGDAQAMQAAQAAAMAGGMGAGNAQMMAAMQAMQAQMAQMGTGGAGMPPGMPQAMGASGEGGGKALEVSSDLPGDLKKGKTVIRNIDWIPGGETVSPSGADGFAWAMAQVAAAMKQAGGAYRLDLYMDKQSGDAMVGTLGPQRLAAVQAALVEGGATPGADGPQIGKSKKAGDPRLEIVRLK